MKDFRSLFLDLEGTGRFVALSLSFSEIAKLCTIEQVGTDYVTYRQVAWQGSHFLGEFAVRLELVEAIDLRPCVEILVETEDDETADIDESPGEPVPVE